MELPAGYRLRAPTPGDLDAMAEVLIADELGEAGQVVLGTDFVRDEWSRVGFDLATDAWVVADDAGVIAGYAQAMLEEPAVVESWGVVHPAHRGRCIGSVLLNLAEERASCLLAGLASGGTVALGDPWQRRALACVLRSDCHSELVEDRAEPVAGGDVKGDVVVAAAQILHEGMTGGQDPR